jgi:SAM-dependent methyltransferase
MDLIERQGTLAQRHPWETARVEAVRQLVSRLRLDRPRVLDIGCGDGFLLDRLRETLAFSEAVGQDIHLSERTILELCRPELELVRQLSQLNGRHFDLILMLDVLEHVEDPIELLSHVWQRHLVERGSVLLTVPAFQWLFTQHDRNLKHFRRYSRRQLEGVARGSGLNVRQSGYLFSSLLLPRAASVLKERLRGPAQQPGFGVGSWQGSPRLTRVLHQVLCLDNHCCLKAQTLGVSLPGLSSWVSCSAP